MFFLLVCCIALVNAGFYEDHFDYVQRALEKENQQNKDKSSWKAGLNKNFANKSLMEIKMMMGSNKETPEASNTIPKPSKEELELSRMNTDLPEKFDAREHWPKCTSLISHIKDQSNCGSCWAVSAASAMSDRTCIASDGNIQTQLSDEELLTCCTSCGFGCNGGYPARAFKYWVNNGLPSGGPYGDVTSCKPYSIKPCKGKSCGSARTPKCTASCIPEFNGTMETDRHYGSTWFHFWFGESSMMKDIYLHGPIVAGFTVYSDFLYYKSGVYEHKTGVQLGGHAVRIIGWGVEDNKNYWLVANSWNTTFGENGLFKIRRGVYECGIELLSTAGYAKFA